MSPKPRTAIRVPVLACLVASGVLIATIVLAILAVAGVVAWWIVLLPIGVSVVAGFAFIIFLAVLALILIRELDD